MDPWTVGLIIVVVVGLGLIVYGALWDRAKNRSRAAEMLAPPNRSIPQFAPDAPAPSYLSDLQARRPPDQNSALSAADRQTIAQQLTRPDTISIAAGYASKDFVTDPTSGWAVLDRPVVLVCGDSVHSLREILPLLEKLVLSRTPLVIIAPEVARDVRTTLEVNSIRRTMSLLAIEAPDEARQSVVDVTGATATDQSDRQAGYVPSDHLGRCERWIATAKQSYLINGAADPVR